MSRAPEQRRFALAVLEAKARELLAGALRTPVPEEPDVERLAAAAASALVTTPLAEVDGVRGTTDGRASLAQLLHAEE